MELTYKIAIFSLIFLGFGHAGFTFKKFKKFAPEALWFFSASLTLVLKGLFNYVDLNIPNILIQKLTIVVNIFQIIFNLILVIVVKAIQTYLALIISAILLVSSIYIYLKM